MKASQLTHTHADCYKKPTNPSKEERDERLLERTFGASGDRHRVIGIGLANGDLTHTWPLAGEGHSHVIDT